MKTKIVKFRSVTFTLSPECDETNFSRRTSEEIGQQMVSSVHSNVQLLFFDIPVAVAVLSCILSFHLARFDLSANLLIKFPPEIRNMSCCTSFING